MLKKRLTCQTVVFGANSYLSSHQLTFRSASDLPLHFFLHELQYPAAARPPSALTPHAHVYYSLRARLPIPESIVMVDYRAPSYQFPQRKPVYSVYPQVGPTKNFGINPAPATNPYSSQSVSPQGSYSHIRRRTSSSGALPAESCPANYSSKCNPNANANPSFPPVAYLNRRSGSGSSSNTSTGGRMDSTGPITLRRSGSNHTASSIVTTSANAYVTYLRRQKATVWCDKSQYEDPRLLAAQRVAKLRAAIEVVGSSTSAFLNASYHGHGLGSGNGSSASSLNAGRSGKLGRGSNHVTSSVKKAWVGTTGPGIVGGSLPRGVPDRLSATEVLGDEDEDETFVAGPGINRRSGSGKSSLNSNHRKTNRSSSIRSDTNRASSTYGTGSGGLQHRSSTSSTPNYSPTSSIAEFDGKMKMKRSGSTSPPDRVEHRNHYDNSNYIAGTPRRDTTLKRRGSLNEEEVVRTMTMSNVRLFVANPDV